jgi:hypothetical protein
MNKILLVIALLMMILYIGKRHQYIRLEEQMNQTQRISDSLRSELFTSDVQLNRYQMTLELMRENDSTCSILFEEIMSMETE